MPNKSNIFYFLIIMCLFKFSFSEKKIIVIEGDNLDLAIKNSTENKFKLFLVFHVKNCPYCTHALKVLKNQVLKNFDEEEEIFFGSVDLDNQLNVWVGLRFNITRIPYIILIENNKIYHYENQFEESLVMKFINEEKNIEDAFDIPKEITLFSKLKAALNELSSKIERFLEMYGVNKKWSKIISYLSIIFVITSFIYLESKLIDSCKNSCKKKNVNESIKEEKNENKKDDKEKIKKD